MRNSLFAPEKIIGSQKGSKESALNFISGGSPLASSVFSGAKNNIVGFNRAKISPKRNNLGSLISTLTTNIFNNTNSVSNIFGDKKEKSEKGFKPFGGFFDKVKEAIGFISFFGSKKNLDKIKENIDNLKTTFIETFDVAKALRKAILKIIEQLSGFSGGGGGGGIIGALMSALGGLVGGLIPGMGGKRPPNVAGPTMKQEGNLLSKMPKGLQGGGGIGKLLLGGAAALGTGAAVSGLSQPGGEEVQPGDTAPEVPGNLLDKFNSILDRFDKALDGLRGGKGKKGSDSSAKSSGSSGGSKTDPGGAGGGGDGGAGGAVAPSIAGSEREMLKKLMIAEAGGQGELGMATVGRSVLNRAGLVQSGNINAGQFNAKSGSIKDIISASGQYQPYAQGKLNRDLSAADNARAEKALQVAENAELLKQLLSATGKSKAEVNKLAASTGFRAGYAFDDPSQNVNVVKLGDHYFNTAGNARMIVPGAQIKPGQQAPQTPTKPAPIKPGQQAPQTPTKPGQQAPQVSLVNVGSGTPQASPSRPSSTTTPPSPTGGNGPTAPFLPSYNPDNFLTLYSRMVYNIVG